MAELTLDPKLTQEACETIYSSINGEAMGVVVEAFGIAQKVGEGNPLVEHLQGQFKNYESFFNEEFKPAVNKVITNLSAFSELAQMFNNLSFSSVSHEDVGVVEDNNYDAAKNL